MEQTELNVQALIMCSLTIKFWEEQNWTWFYVRRLKSDISSNVSDKKSLPTIKEWGRVKKGSKAKRSLKSDMKNNENDEIWYYVIILFKE